MIKAIVEQSRICIGTFGNDLKATLKNQFAMPLQLPADLENHSYIFQFPKNAYEMAVNKKIFI
jgi:hypothetical protein